MVAFVVYVLLGRAVGEWNLAHAWGCGVLRFNRRGINSPVSISIVGRSHFLSYTSWSRLEVLAFKEYRDHAS